MLANINNQEISVQIVAGDPNSSNVIVRLVGEHEKELIAEETKTLENEILSGGWCMIAIPVSDWEKEMAPFNEGANATLQNIINIILPKFELAYPDIERSYIIAGYSLAGLFALWASYQTDKFKSVAAVSPSVWYPEWIQYADTHKCKSGKVYLSLGKKEHKTRNRMMATVKDNIELQKDILIRQGIDVTLDWNEGNHFTDVTKRMVKGEASVLTLVNQQ